MSKTSTYFLRFVLLPICCVIFYSVTIGFAVEVGYSFFQEEYSMHEGFIYMVSGVVGITIVTIWLLIKRRMIWTTPKIHIGRQEDYIYALVMALAMLGISTLYFMLVSRLKTQVVQDSLDHYNEMMAINTKSKIDTWLNFLATCLFIPVLEEMLFRGCIMEGMLTCSHPVVAIVASGLFFGAMHIQPIQVGYAMIAGMFLGTIYYLTNSLVLPIVAHIVFNFFGSGIYMLTNVSEHTTYIFTIIELSSIVIAIALTVFMIIKYKERFPKEEPIGDISKMLPGRHT